MKASVCVADRGVGEVVVLAAARGIEAAGVPREGETTPLEAERAPLAHVEAQTQTERRRDRHTRSQLEALGAAAGARLTIAALLQAHEGRTAEEVQVRIDVDALEQRDLAAERHERDLRGHHPVHARELILEVVSELH